MVRRLIMHPIAISITNPHSITGSYPQPSFHPFYPYLSYHPYQTKPPHKSILRIVYRYSYRLDATEPF